MPIPPHLPSNDAAWLRDLPYAPRRDKPLSPWKPWDYLVLLYWIFLFPQALRWYVWERLRLGIDKTTFAMKEQEITLEEKRVRTIITRKLLVIMVLVPIIFTIVSVIVFFKELQKDISSINQIFIASAVSYTIAGIVLLYYSFLRLFSVNVIQLICVFIIAQSIYLGLIFFPNLFNTSTATYFIVGITLGYCISIAGNLVQNNHISIGISFVLGIIISIFVLVFDRSVPSNASIFIILSVDAALLISVLRPDSTVLAAIASIFQHSQRFAIAIQRCSSLPIFRLKKRLGQRLTQQWVKSIPETEGLYRYSAQSDSITSAVQIALTQTSNDQLVDRIAYWCSLPIANWNMVRSQSAGIRTRMWAEFVDELWFVPKRFRPAPSKVMRYDTPARAACAAFVHLNEQELDKAVMAFEHVRDLPYGAELHANAVALAAAAASDSLDAIARWQPPTLPMGELLRPQAHAILTTLGTVAQDAALITQSKSRTQRSTALNRAVGALSELELVIGDCPRPEQAVLEQIRANWLRQFQAIASTIGRIEAVEQVESPYIVGAWVPAKRLVGRSDIFHIIESRWVKAGQRDSLIIYGQRRIGKTSIARNLLHFCNFGADTALAVLNLQSIDLSEGLSDLCYKIASELWSAAPLDLQEPDADEFADRPLVALRNLLDAIRRQPDHQRYILVLDEYEVLEEALTPAVLHEFVSKLRGWTQDNPWLVMALVGLHTLEEMSGDYFQPIYSWRPIKVGLMDEDAVSAMLQIEDDSFTLEYNPSAITLIYKLTGGQPMLAQLIGDSLVERFNEQQRYAVETISQLLTVVDVAAVISNNTQFIENARVYFRGVWQQASENPGGQQQILTSLALAVEKILRREYEAIKEVYVLSIANMLVKLFPIGFGEYSFPTDSIPLLDLQAATDLDPTAFTLALDALKRHDVIEITEAGECRFRVELLRRWIVDGGYGSPAVG